MTSFDVAFEWMLPHEDSIPSGKVTNEPSGGVAKFGINSKAYPNVDVPNLTLDEAKIIYERDFWKKFLLDQLVSQQLASKVFDMLVNLEHIGVQILQRCLSLAPDGFIGPKTIAAANRMPAGPLVKNLCMYQALHYKTEAALGAAKGYNYPIEGLLGRAACVPPPDPA